jgi:hypothetical protein
MMRKALLYTALATVIGASAGGIAPAFAAGQGGGASGQKAAAMFDKCDKNGDGSVSADEFKACRGDSAKAEKKFKRMDANNDGSVTRDEAQQWAAHKKSSRGGSGAGSGPGPHGGAMTPRGTGSSQ